MKLSMDIFAEEMKDIVVSARLREDTALDLESVRFLEEGEEPAAGMLYVGTKLPEKVQPYLNMLYIGVPKEEKELGNANIIVLKPECDEHAVFNRTLNIFQKYGRWHNQLTKLLDEHSAVQNFLDASQPIFRAGITLLDWDHNCIAVTRVKMENCPLWDAILDGYGYKYKFMIEQSSPKIRELSRMEQNWSNIDSRYLYNFPLYINGMPMFGLALHKMENPSEKFGKNISQLYEVLGGIVTQRLAYENQLHPTRSILYDTFVRDVINGKVTDPDKFNKEHHFIQFNEGDHLLLGVVVFKSINYRSAFLVESARELEAIWPGSICSVVDAQLMWVINMKDVSYYQYAPQTQRDTVDRWMEQKVARCGISPPFDSLALMQLSYQQSFSALHYGLACDNIKNKYIYNFFDHLDYQILNMASATADLSKMIHPVLHKLISFDKLHHTDYYETFREFLITDDDQTINQLADKLHIHRNTLHYRLDKIQEITGIDYKDNEIKRQISISLYCIDIFPNCRCNEE